MLPTLRRNFTVVVMILILAPVSYYVAVQSASSTHNLNPLSFVPQNSTAALSLSEGRNQVIAFATPNETGYVFRANPAFVYGLIMQHNLNFSSNITLTKFSEYYSAVIYRLSNVQPISIVANTSLRIALQKLGANNTTALPSESALFFSNPGSNIFVLGGLASVRSSISQWASAKGAGLKFGGLDMNAELSFAVKSPVKGYIDKMTGNLTGHTLSVMVTFAQSLYAADFFALYILSLLGKGVVIVPQNTVTDKVTMNLNSVQYLPFFGLVKSALGGL